MSSSRTCLAWCRENADPVLASSRRFSKILATFETGFCSGESWSSRRKEHRDWVSEKMVLGVVREVSVSVVEEDNSVLDLVIPRVDGEYSSAIP